MNRLDTESLNGVAARWAETIWAISWQFCLLGLIVLLIHGALRQAAPNWRYWLWQILAIKLLLMPFWTAAAPWKGNRPAPATIESTANLEPVDELHERHASSTVAPVQANDHPDNRAAGTQSRDVKHTSTPHAPPATPVEQTRSSTPTIIARTFRSDARPHAQVAPALNANPVVKSEQAPKSTSDRDSTADTGSTDAPAHFKHTQISNEPAETVAEYSLEVPQRSGLSWQAWLMLTWLSGVGWCGCRILRQGRALSRRLRDTEPAGPELLRRVRDAAARLGMTRVPEVCVIDLDVSPFVCGLWRVRLVVPRGLFESFSPEQLDLVLLHELAHVRRRDLLWGWIPEIGRILFFFHPLVYIVGHQIRFERELACDQLAMLSSGRDAATYADTLVRVVGQFSSSESFKLAVAEK